MTPGFLGLCGADRWSARFFREKYRHAALTWKTIPNHLYAQRKTHATNNRWAKHLESAFGAGPLVDIAADSIQLYLRDRLRRRVRIKKIWPVCSSHGNNTAQERSEATMARQAPLNYVFYIAATPEKVWEGFVSPESNRRVGRG
jgi:hypothetical protein